jgi:hypothetical protein
MKAGEATGGGASPAAVYSQALKELKQAQAVEQRREVRLGYSKLAIAALTLIAAFFLFRVPSYIEFLAAPVGLFVVLAVLQEKLIRRLRLRARAIEFYERGLARLEDRWAGSGETGERFLDPAHPYARDLDLFGTASLFELLCTARTRSGEETLAAWLLAAAPEEQILARQSAVRDLTDRVGFRERLFLLGDTVRAGLHPDALAAWGEGKAVFPARRNSGYDYGVGPSLDREPGVVGRVGAGMVGRRNVFAEPGMGAQALYAAG